MTDSKQLTASEAARNRVFAMEEKMQHGLPDDMELIDLPLREFYADGCYVREVFMPAGSFVTGRIHKHRHVSICSMGRMQVFDETGLKEVKAGDIFISEPGIKRALHMLEDSRFINVLRMPDGIMEGDTDALISHFTVATNEEFNHYLMHIDEVA